jgi:hypothetical protein
VKAATEEAVVVADTVQVAAADTVQVAAEDTVQAAAIGKTATNW